MYIHLRNNNEQLEGNCDFSSNNNIWAMFYDILAAIFNFVGSFYYDKLIVISRTSFLAAILNCNFRLQTSNLVTTELLYF